VAEFLAEKLAAGPLQEVPLLNRFSSKSLVSYPAQAAVTIPGIIGFLMMWTAPGVFMQAV